MAAVPIKMHRNEANHCRKPYPIVLKPVHILLPFPDYW
jgi:hypothetical protein